LAILKVAQLGHPVLRQVAREVTPDELASPQFQQLLDDLLDTMIEYDGTGLAAPQVHAPFRAVVLTLTDSRGPEYFVNPRITVLSDTTRRTWEGCLSVEGFRGLVVRPDHIRIDALDRDGTEKTLEVRGFGAVVLQHECDHLDGTLYVDKVMPRSLVTTKEFRRWGPPEEFVDLEADYDDEGEDGELDADTYDDEPVEQEA
jgi:peptide deformylase